MPELERQLSSNDNLDAETVKKLLEFELSHLDADDMRSHAWYHGSQVDRAGAERLLRKCVTEEHGVVRDVDEDIGYADSDSNGLEDVSSVSSDGDFGPDDNFFDEPLDERRQVQDSSTAMSPTMAASLSLLQRRRIDNLLPKRSARPTRQWQRHFYCFLVRDSLNVRPPGRYVVSCLRVDKYNDENYGSGSDGCGIGDNDENRKKMRSRQIRRRLRRQRQHQVLHFVINEVIYLM